MRAFFLSFVTAFLLALPLKADETAFRDVISSQIEALQRDDFQQAFTYASPSIRRIFGTPENFGRMVQQGYPMVWRPQEIRFLDVETIQSAPWQSVLIRDEAGQLFFLRYQMISVESSWKINAVHIERAGDGAA